MNCNGEPPVTMQTQSICKKQPVGINHFVRCMEDDPTQCAHSVPLGSAYFCQFPHANCYEPPALKIASKDFLPDTSKARALMT